MNYNKSVFLISLVLSLTFSGLAQKNYTSKVWIADKGDGTYQNPILHADYSDPDAIRVGNDFYMTASSFNCIPGLPILHSKDLVNWKLIGYALKKQYPEEIYDKPQHGNGVWAPAIRFHKGEFYIYYPDPDFGIYLVKAKNPSEEWSKPQLVMAGKGIIDPAPFWDKDGKAYLSIAWANSRAGVNSLLTIYRMNPEGTQIIDDGKHVFDGHEFHHTVEGPKIYIRNGYYYIFAPAGGVVNGWQLILRSKNIYGPYEEKVVLAQGKTNINGPHQGVWVETQSGESWFLHFQDKGAYGRITHLQPMKWVNDWPVIGTDSDGDGTGEPVLSYKKPNVGTVHPIQTPAESDEFNVDTLGLQWQWHANAKIQWMALLKNKGYIRLFSVKQKDSTNFWSAPNLLMQKFPAPDFSATTKIKYTTNTESAKTGLVIMGTDYAYISLSKTGKNFTLTQTTCSNADKNGIEKPNESVSLTDSCVYLRVNVNQPDAKCVFSYSTDGIKFISIGKEFYARQDKWIGAKVGIFCNKAGSLPGTAYTDFDWFRIDK